MQPQPNLNPNRPVVPLVNRNNFPIHCNYAGMFPKNNLTIKTDCPPQAAAAFREDYRYLGAHLVFDPKEPAHSHTKGASDRTTADLAAKLGEMRGLKVLDIAGSIWRNLRTNDVNREGHFINRSLSERVWTTFVKMDARDDHRAQNLEIKLQQAADSDFLRACMANFSCDHIAGDVPSPDHDSCTCRSNSIQAINCTDAVYYPGVFEEIFRMMKRNKAFAIVSFVDYHKAWTENKFSGSCCDEESTFKFTTSGIWHEVKGNIAPYTHKIVATGGRDTFCYKFEDGHYIFEKAKRTKNGDLTYVSFKITYVSRPVENAHYISDILVNPVLSKDMLSKIAKNVTGYESNTFGAAEALSAAPVVKDYAYYAARSVKNYARIMTQDIVDGIKSFQDTFDRMSICEQETMTYLPDSDEYRLTLVTGTWWGFASTFKVYTVPAAPVENLFSSFLYRKQLGEHTRISKAAFVTLTANPVDGVAGPKGWGLRIKEATDVQIVTTILAQRIGVQFLETVMTTASKKRLDDVMNGALVYKTTSFILNLWHFAPHIALFIMIALYQHYNGVRAEDVKVKQETPNEWVLMIVALICMCGIKAIFSSPKINKKKRVRDPTWYETDCLHDDKLCDLSDLGRIDPKFQCKGEVLNMFPNNWSCDAKSRVGPVVIGPRYMGVERDNIATQNHACKRSDAAAVKRMVGLKSTYDPVVMEEFVEYVRSVHFPRFLDTLDQNTYHVNFEDWLTRFSLNYRKKIIKEAEDIDGLCFQNRSNKMHSKTDELNVPSFCQADRETELNKVKKRAIAGPSDWEKYIANPSCYVISKISGATYAEYNVGRNYMETSSRVEEIEGDIPNVIFVAADGSGFDMTQYPRCNELWNELVALILTHPNLEWEQDVTLPLIQHVLDKNLKLNMTAMNGDLKFECQGRGSGHGWTTVANTNLNIWYYSFLMHKANVPPSQWDGLFQGDDSIIGVNEYYRIDIENWKNQLFLDNDDGRAFGLGQICKKMTWGDIEEMEFTSCHFFHEYDGGIRMVRIGARILTTVGLSTSVAKPGKSTEMSDEMIDAWFRKEGIQKQIRELSYAKAQSGLDWCRGLRIWELLYMKMWELSGIGEITQTEKFADTKREDWNSEYRVWHAPHEDLGAYTAWFCRRYDVLPSDIVSFEEEIIKLTSLYDVVHHPLVDRIIEVDLLG